MEILDGFYLDYSNKKACKYFERYASRMVKIVEARFVAEKTTGKIIGVVMVPKGIMAKYIIKKFNSFMKGPSKMVIWK